MTEKEASVFIIDVGRSMGQKRHGRSVSDLDYSLRFFYDKITNTIATGRKTLFVGIVALRTEETSNPLQDSDGYENITQLQPIQQMLLPDLQALPPKLVPRATDAGDALSAIILGIDMVTKHCRQLKYIKNLYLITNGSGHIDTDDLEAVADQLKSTNIKLTVLGVDFDDAEYGYKEEDKPFDRTENEKALKKLTELAEGTLGTMQEAVEALERPSVKPVRPIAGYKGQLRLGGAEYETAITIDIERYPKVMVKRPPTASTFAIREGAQGPTVEENGDGESLAPVRAAYSYQVKDEDTATGYREIPREELAKGYEYGRTAVAISESDESITKLVTEQSYDILGFLPGENVERYLMMSNTHMVVPNKINDKAAIALSSVVHALHELNSVAVARFVQKDMKEPMLVMLSPLISPEVECLIENDLPFAEDLRVYRFPPTDKLFTVGGKQIKEHRNLPKKDLVDAMSDYVDSMSLVDSTERLAIDDTFSPMYHTIDQAIKYRAVHPDKGLPDKPTIVLEPSHVPADIQESSKAALVQLVKAADVKKVPPKVKGRARWRDRETEKPISGLDIDALLNSKSAQTANSVKKTVQIDPNNAIPEFKRLMQYVDDEKMIKTGVSQMGSIADNLVTKSIGDVNYERVVEILTVVRDEMIEYEMSELYNDLIRGMKMKLQKGEMGGDRKEFWWRVRVAKVGLIDEDESEASKITAEEAAKFMRWTEQPV